MYVFFRLFMIGVLGWFRDRLEPLEEGRIRLRAYPNDVDFNLHINNGRYLTLMDIGRFDWVFRTGLIGICLKNRWNPVAGAAKIKFIRPINLFRTFELRTQLASWDEKWIYIRQEFYVDGEISAIANIRVLFRKGRKKIPTALLQEAVGLEGKTPPIPPSEVDL